MRELTPLTPGFEHFSHGSLLRPCSTGRAPMRRRAPVAPSRYPEFLSAFFQSKKSPTQKNEEHDRPLSPALPLLGAGAIAIPSYYGTDLTFPGPVLPGHRDAPRPPAGDWWRKRGAIMVA